jgi:hypothetical protein
MRPNASGRHNAARGRLGKGCPFAAPDARRGQTGIAEPKPVDVDRLTRRNSSIVNEIWSINDITEVKECVFEEVQPVNYARFVVEVLKLCMDAEAENQLMADASRVRPSKDLATALDSGLRYQAGVCCCDLEAFRFRD